MWVCQRLHSHRGSFCVVLDSEFCFRCGLTRWCSIGVFVWEGHYKTNCTPLRGTRTWNTPPVPTMLVTCISLLALPARWRASTKPGRNRALGRRREAKQESEKSKARTNVTVTPIYGDNKQKRWRSCLPKFTQARIHGLVQFEIQFITVNDWGPRCNSRCHQGAFLLEQGWNPIWLSK